MFRGNNSGVSHKEEEQRMLGSLLRGRFSVSLLAAAACATLIGCAGGGRVWERIIPRATTDADILRAIDEFKARLGGVDNDGAAGSQPSGFRLIGWDAIGAGFLNSNTFPGNFFNSNSRRGLV